jgi:hypothetical protein
MYVCVQVQRDGKCMHHYHLRTAYRALVVAIWYVHPANTLKQRTGCSAHCHFSMYAYTCRLALSI